MSEVEFQGTSALTLDTKGRLTVPARHRDALAGGADRSLIFTKSNVNCLFVFQHAAWADFRKLLVGLPMQADGWRRLFLGSAVAVDVDSADRVLVPSELRAWAGLERDVLLIGMGRRLELWDVGRHAAEEARTLSSPMPDVVQNFVF